MKKLVHRSFAPIPINGTRIKPKDAIHRRKLLTVQAYVKNLLATSRPNIAKIILFGSVAKGEATQDSDIDVMVLGFENLDALRDASYDAMLELGDLSGEGIEPLFETIEEWIQPQDYFMYRVTRYGKEIYSMPDEEIKSAEAEDWLSLAKEYLAFAEQSFGAEHWRAVADLAYNAAELCVKALLLFKMDDFPRSHGGLVGKFGELFVKDGPFARNLGARLNRGLEVRSWARYRHKAVISREIAEDNLNLAKEMISILDNELKKRK